MTNEERTDNVQYKIELLKTMYEMWRHENDIVNQKIAIYFAAQSILMVAIASAPILTAIVGLVISLIWFTSIGRTIVYRLHWKERIEKVLETIPQTIQHDYHLFPTNDEEKKMSWYGRVPSNIILLGTPAFGIIFWLVSLIIYW